MLDESTHNLLELKALERCPRSLNRRRSKRLHIIHAAGPPTGIASVCKFHQTPGMIKPGVCLRAESDTYSASGWSSGRAASKAGSFSNAASTADILGKRSSGTLKRRAL
jgi:hypothetical protein